MLHAPLAGETINEGDVVITAVRATVRAMKHRGICSILASVLPLVSLSALVAGGGLAYALKHRKKRIK